MTQNIEHIQHLPRDSCLNMTILLSIGLHNGIQGKVGLLFITIALDGSMRICDCTQCNGSNVN
jgi:hypothetical protein